MRRSQTDTRRIDRVAVWDKTARSIGLSKIKFSRRTGESTLLGVLRLLLVALRTKKTSFPQGGALEDGESLEMKGLKTKERHNCHRSANFKEGLRNHLLEYSSRIFLLNET